MLHDDDAVPGAVSVTSRSYAGHENARRAFYDRIRRKFLQQSAGYLHSGLTKGTAAPFAGNSPVHP